MLKMWKKGISLITPTGDRHVAFARCEEYIKRQTYSGPLEWIVVDDGEVRTNITQNQIYIKAPPSKNKLASFSNNFKELISHISYDKVLVIEDDDWYGVNYIEKMNKRLECAPLVGEYPAKYYNVKHKKYKIFSEKNSHCSLCQTGFRKELLGVFYKFLDEKKHVDIRFWKEVKHCIRYKDFNCVGIKGMPGREGITTSHSNSDGFVPDSNLDVLKKWVGQEDVEFYRKIYNCV